MFVFTTTPWRLSLCHRNISETSSLLVANWTHVQWERPFRDRVQVSVTESSGKESAENDQSGTCNTAARPAEGRKGFCDRFSQKWYSAIDSPLNHSRELSLRLRGFWVKVSLSGTNPQVSLVLDTHVLCFLHNCHFPSLLLNKFVEIQSECVISKLVLQD